VTSPYKLRHSNVNSGVFLFVTIQDTSHNDRLKRNTVLRRFLKNTLRERLFHGNRHTARKQRILEKNDKTSHIQNTGRKRNTIKNTEALLDVSRELV